MARRTRKSATAQARKRGMDLSAFAAPASFSSKGKPSSRVAQILDALGVGAYSTSVFDLDKSQKPPMIRKVSKKKLKGKGGLHTYNGPYIKEEIIQLARDDARSGEVLIALGAADSISAGGWAESKKRASTTSKDAIKYVNDVVYYGLVVNQKDMPKYRQDKPGVQGIADRIERAATQIATISSDVKTNPIDTLEFIRDGLIQEIRKFKPFVDGSGTRAANNIGGLLNLITNSNDTAAEMVKTAKQLARRFGSSGIGLLKSTGKFLNATLAKLAVPVTAKGRPFKVPTSRSSKVDTVFGKKTGTTKPVFGFEIEKITYYVQNLDGGPPKELMHTSAAIAAEQHPDINTPQELAYAIRNYTPCGRVWLCYSEASKSMFIASDKKSNQKLFLNGERKDTLSYLFNRTKAPRQLFGFVF